MSNMSIIHIWIGTTRKTEEEYLKYFELDYSTEGDFDVPGYKLCPFCKDINQRWYGEDLIGIIPLFGDEYPILQLLETIPIDKNEIEKVIGYCRSVGLDFGNAIFYYTDAELWIDNSTRKTYNGLKYIGRYRSCLR